MTGTPAQPTREQLMTATSWCMRVSDNDLSPHDRKKLETWLNADPLHQSAFEAVVATWRTVDSHASAPEVLTVRKRALAMGARTWKWRAIRRHFTPKSTLALAASTVAIAVAVGFWWLLHPSVIETRVGERRTLTLSDGSRVFLDASTRLSYRFTQEQRRIVLSTGRAMFDVAKSPLRPFSVEAGGRVVVAVGTSFSVELVNREVRVMLYEGKVNIYQPAAPAKLARMSSKQLSTESALAPGYSLVSHIDTAAVEVTPIDPVRSQSWEGGMLAFDDEPLASAVERINRYADPKIQIGDAQAGRARISGLFQAGNVDAFIEGVTSALPVTARPTEGHIEIMTR